MQITSTENGRTGYELSVLYGNFTGKIKHIGTNSDNVLDTDVTINGLPSLISYNFSSPSYLNIQDISIPEGVYTGLLIVDCSENVVRDGAFSNVSFEILNSDSIEYNPQLVVNAYHGIEPSTITP